MQKRKSVSIMCDNCGTQFEKAESEVIRNKKLQRKNYCSRKCCGLSNIKNLPEGGSGYDISQHSGHLADEFTVVRCHLTRAKSRNYEVTVSLQDLKDQWELQEGLCNYTKIPLVKPNSKGKNSTIFTASLDRIDSSKGYIVGNIQFVSMGVNFMKSTMTHDEVLKFINLIKEN